MRFGRNDFALPHIFAEDQQDIARAPGPGQINKSFRALDVEVADGSGEIGQAERANWQGNDRKIELLAGASDERNLLSRDADRLSVNVHRIKPIRAMCLRPTAVSMPAW